jgi:glycosyltransferase involved in cell wall biosynthesis
MKVSVIIPCYNCEKKIGETLEALGRQSTEPSEIVVIDDGSTDNTKKTVREKQKLNKKIKFFYQKNSGPAKARNAGANRAAGEIIVFTDSDCVPEKNWLEEMIKPFENKKENVSGVQGAYKSRQKEFIARFGQLEIEERYEKMKKAKKIDWIGSYSAAFKKNEFIKLNGYDESFPIASGEDPEFSFRLAKNGGKLVFNPNAVVYHIHPDNLKKYLKTKFFRAFFRPKMYSKHREKALNDSYTPQILKLQIPLSWLVVLSIIGFFFFGPLPFLCMVIVFLITTIPFAFFAAKKDFLIGVVSPGIIFLRSIIFGAGLAAGMLGSEKK